MVFTVSTQATNIKTRKLTVGCWHFFVCFVSFCSTMDLQDSKVSSRGTKLLPEAPIGAVRVRPIAAFVALVAFVAGSKDAWRIVLASKLLAVALAMFRSGFPKWLRIYANLQFDRFLRRK